MAVALKILILYLVAEFLAHTFIVLCALKSAGAVAARANESFLNRRDDLGVFVKPYLHLYFSIRREILALGT